MASFREVFKCIGVDADVAPNANMFVPLHGSNIVAVTDGAGLKPVPERPLVKVEEIADGTLLNTARKMVHDALAHIPDQQAAAALSPDLWTGQARFYEVRAIGRVDSPGVTVQLGGGSSRGTNGKLQVVVGDRLVFRLAIRNINVIDMDGTPWVHSNKPGDAKEEIKVINAVWTSQTNIEFKLVSSSPVTIDMRKQATRDALAKAYGSSSVDKLSDRLHADELKDVMVGVMTEVEKAEGKKPDFTLFKVRTILSGGTASNPGTPSGHTVRAGRYAFVADTRWTTTMAHETGHFLAGPTGWGDKSQYVSHPYDKGVTLLMRDGGAGWKIPFKDTVGKFRPFVEQTIKAR